LGKVSLIAIVVGIALLIAVAACVIAL